MNKAWMEKLFVAIMCCSNTGAVDVTRQLLEAATPAAPWSPTSSLLLPLHFFLSFFFLRHMQSAKTIIFCSLPAGTTRQINTQLIYWALPLFNYLLYTYYVPGILLGDEDTVWWRRIWPQSYRAHSLEKGEASLVCKGPDGKYFRLCDPYSLPHSDVVWKRP